MPDLSGLQLPAPRDWPAFQRLCRDVFAELWNDPSAQQNGRAGQPQAGVDVFGRINRTAQIGGVQCKLKDQLSNRRTLSKAELTDEITKAKTFQPPLTAFYIATTGPLDASIQEEARRITREHAAAGLFSVEIWSWEDILDIIGGYEHIVRKHYPQLFIVESGSDCAHIEIQVGSTTHDAEVRSFFESTRVRTLVRGQLRTDLRILITELTLNAFAHGNARRCSIHITDDTLLFQNNGDQFDPITRANADNWVGGGLRFLSEFLEKYDQVVDALYSHDPSSGNKIAFACPAGFSSPDADKSCVILLKGVPRPGVPIPQVAEIPLHCKEVFLRVVEDSLDSLSQFRHFLNPVLDKLPMGTKLIITCPDGVTKNALSKLYSQRSNIEIR